MKALTTALIALTLAAPAQAWEFDAAHTELKDTVEHLMTVTVDHEDCEDGPYAGWISSQGIVACSVNSKSFDDFQDTLRHEGVHLAQRCKAYNNQLPGYSILSPTAVSRGRVLFHRVLQQYQPHQRGYEAEAWYIASLRDPQLVDDAIRTHCSFAF